MDYVQDTILGRVRAEREPPGLVVLDLSATPYVDMHSAHMLADLAGELTAGGVRVRVVEARSSVRDRLRSEGVDEGLGGMSVFLWVFLSTFPVVVPFLVMSSVGPAMRVSNAIALAMLIMTGYAFGRCAGRQPWLTGFGMVGLGGVLVGLTIALGD
ncbi:MAG: sodium-independent anion transporter [Phycisphaerales bacterium]